MGSGIWLQHRVGVLLGGISSERAVSLRSGAAMVAALARRGYRVQAIDAGRDLNERLRQQPIDVALLAVHGCWGEDGQLQGLLETLAIPYSGSGVAASAIGMDKVLTKRLLRDAGIATPPWWSFRLAADDAAAIAAAVATLSTTPHDWFVKPASGGSSVATGRATDPPQLAAALQRAAAVAPTQLVEQTIVGAEVTVSVLNGVALPAIQICPREGFYDYTNKYSQGRTDYLIPPRDVDSALLPKLAALAELAYNTIGCRGVARVDFIVTAAGDVWLLEINTLPGMTETSLAPKAAAAVGITFDELVERMLESATLDGCDGDIS